MQAVAKLKNLPISPRKVRLVADLIRGASATQGLAILKHTSKKCAIHLEKLLLAAVSSWEHKNEDIVLEEAGLCIKAVWVDGAGMLKRLRPAPQGRAHRIRKRSSHITLIVDGTKREVQPGGIAKGVPVKTTNQTEHNTDGAKS
jgi:large subunit ribosomal protein L22